MKKMSYLLLLLSCCLSCQQSQTDINQVAQLEKELAEVKQKLAATAKPDNEPALIHMVYLNTKADLSPDSKNQLLTAIKALAKIPVVSNLKPGNFKNMSDPRALSQFEMAFQMEFRDSADYVIYQKHPIHLELRAVAKELLEGPPVTYDYWTE